MTKKEQMISKYATALIALDYQNDEYEMLETPLTKKLHMKTEGSINELEESGAIYPESLRALRVARDGAMELYENGFRESVELHALVHIMAADMTKYVPISVSIAFDWSEDVHAVDTAYGILRPAKDVPAIDVPREDSVSA